MWPAFSPGPGKRWAVPKKPLDKALAVPGILRGMLKLLQFVGEVALLALVLVGLMCLPLIFG